jgi:hypothetical protein
MNNQLLYIGLFALSVTCVYLMYQNTQLKKKFKLIQHNQIQKKAIEKTKDNKNVEPKKTDQIEPFNNKQPINQLTKKTISENEKPLDKNEMTYNILKTQYENYSNSDQYESNSEDKFNSEIESDLKEKIDSLNQFNNDNTLDNTENSLDNTENILDNTENILDNTENIETNTENIETNTENILDNTENILDNTENIETNIENIFDNKEPTLDNVENNLDSVNTLDNIDILDNIDTLDNIENTENIENIQTATSEINTKDHYKVELTELDIQDINMELSKDQNLDSNLNELEDLNNLEELKDIDNLTNNNLDDIDFFKKPTSKPENNDLNDIEKKYTLKELQKIARDNNIKIKGKKEELIERFIQNKINF